MAARHLLIVGDVVIGSPPGRCGLLPERVMDEPPRLRDLVDSFPGSRLREAASPGHRRSGRPWARLD